MLFKTLQLSSILICVTTSSLRAADPLTSINGKPLVIIPKLAAPQELSADPANAQWDNAARVTLNDPVSGATPKLATDARIFCTEDALFLCVACEERSAEPLMTAGEFWQRDEVEIFIEPEADLAKKPYHHILVDCTGQAAFNRYHIYPKYMRQKFAESEWKPKIAAASAKTEHGWSVALKIPFDQLVFTTDAKQRGELWRLNICRARPGRGKESTQLFSWATLGAPQFHSSAKFGYAFVESLASSATRELVMGIDDDSPPDSVRQNVDQWEAREKVSANGDRLPYRLLKPKDFDPQKKYPLLLYLHSGGREIGTDNRSQLECVVFKFGLDPLRSKYPAFVIAPQCPPWKARSKPLGWANMKTDPESLAAFRNPAGYGTFHIADEPSIPMSQIFEILSELQKEFPSIDDKRLYITGTSQGGFGTYDAITRKPELFAAAGPVCGAGDETRAETIKNVPLWIFHGAKDDRVRVDASRAMVEALKKVGANPKYTEFPDKGHAIEDDAYMNEEFLNWMFAQRRP